MRPFSEWYLNYNVSTSGIGEMDAQLLRQGLTKPGIGAGIVNELLIRHPRAPFQRRRGNQQDLASVQGYAGEKPFQTHGGLFRASALEQVVGPKHEDQQIRVCREGGGNSGDLPAILTHVADAPAGFLGKNVHPPAVRIVAVTQIGVGIVAVGVGVAETDDVHPAPPSQ